MGKFNTQMLTENTDEWETPDKLFKKLDDEFHFTLDSCASDENHKVDNYYTIKTDGLRSPWSGVVWCNPPYSNIADWIKKGYEEAQKGCTVVMLIYSKTDTKYWHNHVMKADEIRFIKGRVTFKGAKNTSPAPSSIIVFRPYSKTKVPVLSTYEY
jgi:site-specific DNA-methyltransferase (adenine-specific)